MDKHHKSKQRSEINGSCKILWTTHSCVFVFWKVIPEKLQVTLKIIPENSCTLTFMPNISDQTDKVQPLKMWNGSPLDYMIILVPLLLFSILNIFCVAPILFLVPEEYRVWWHLIAISVNTYSWFLMNRKMKPLFEITTHSGWINSTKVHRSMLETKDMLNAPCPTAIPAYQYIDWDYKDPSFSYSLRMALEAKIAVKSS